MGRPLSGDLRKRVIAAIEGGLRREQPRGGFRSGLPRREPGTGLTGGRDRFIRAGKGSLRDQSSMPMRHLS